MHSPDQLHSRTSRSKRRLCWNKEMLKLLHRLIKTWLSKSMRMQERPSLKLREPQLMLQIREERQHLPRFKERVNWSKHILTVTLLLLKEKWLGQFHWLLNTNLARLSGMLSQLIAYQPLKRKRRQLLRRKQMPLHHMPRPSKKKVMLK